MSHILTYASAHRIIHPRTSSYVHVGSFTTSNTTITHALVIHVSLLFRTCDNFKASEEPLASFTTVLPVAEIS